MSGKKSSSADIHYILQIWKSDPTIDPYTNDTIVLSIHPKSEYVKIYKKVIDELINYIIANKRTIDKQLTIDDCKHIKDSLPFIHANIELSGNVIKYDHLFIKYFIKKEKKYNYNEKYKEDIDIFLYLNVFNSIKYKLRPLPPKIPQQVVVRNSSISLVMKDYNDVKELLVKGNININKSPELSISRLIERLCKDIKKILYAHPSKTTDTDFDIVLKNLEILRYASSIYKLCEVEDVKDFIENENKMVAYFIKLFKDTDRLDPKNENHFIDYIFLQIIIFLIELSPEDEESSEELSIINNIYGYYYYDEINMYIKHDLDKFKKYLEKFKRKSYEEILEKLEKIYIKIICLYNVSSKYKIEKKNILVAFFMELLDENEKKIIQENFTRIIPENINIYKGKEKREIEEANEEIKKKCGPYWSDPLTLDDLEDDDFTYAQRKYITMINKYDTEGNINGSHCFDTMSIYNYLITCIENKIEPTNPNNRKILTIEEIEMICDNVLKLINYNKDELSDLDKKILSEAKSIKHKYKIFRFMFDHEYPIFNIDDTLKLRSTNKGVFKNGVNGVSTLMLHLYINLDFDNENLQFPLCNKLYYTSVPYKFSINFPDQYDIYSSVIILLPFFDDIAKDEYIYYSLIGKIIDIFDNHKLLNKNIFPYRNPNREGTMWSSISTLPAFFFKPSENPEGLFKRVHEYERNNLPK
jgi:hypothetical protein